MSSSSESEANTRNTTASPSIDYQNKDYKAFLFVIHEIYGIVLLHCTRKATKGPHFQCPGGGIDEPEFLAAAELSNGNSTKELEVAGKLGAARELYEEAGMDIRKSCLDRLQPVNVHTKKDEKETASFMWKKRLFFVLRVNDDDFFIQDNNNTDEVQFPFVSPICDDGKHLMLKVSIEHSGYTFEKNLNKAATLIQKHSGGKCAQALLAALKNKELQSIIVVDDNMQQKKKEEEKIFEDLLLPSVPKKEGYKCCLFSW